MSLKVSYFLLTFYVGVFFVVQNGSVFFFQLYEETFDRVCAVEAEVVMVFATVEVSARPWCVFVGFGYFCVANVAKMFVAHFVLFLGFVDGYVYVEFWEKFEGTDGRVLVCVFAFASFSSGHSQQTAKIGGFIV